MNAADIMTRQVVTAHRDTGVSEIARLMLTYRVGAIPIVDDEARVVGIVSDHDLLGNPPSDGPHAWWLRLLDEGAVCLEDIATARDLKVEDVMVRRVTTVSDATPIGVLGSLMRRRKLKHVPVSFIVASSSGSSAAVTCLTRSWRILRNARRPRRPRNTGSSGGKWIASTATPPNYAIRISARDRR